MVQADKWKELRKTPIVKDILRDIYVKKSNCMVGITGRVNTGKSHTGVHLAYLCGKKFRLEESLVYTIEQVLKVTLSFIKVKGKPLALEDLRQIEDMEKWLKENIDRMSITIGKAIILDEAGATSAYVRDFFSQDNKTISKMIQLWRFLRMIVIIIVPEDMKLTESTISRFLNYEILMKGPDDTGKFAGAIAWEYIGWNKTSKSPYKERLDGCRFGGYIRVSPLPQAVADEYDNLSRIYKVKALIEMGTDYKVRGKRGKDIEPLFDPESMKYIRDNLSMFQMNNGKLDKSKLIEHFKIGINKATMYKQRLDRELSLESTNIPLNVSINTLTPKPPKKNLKIPERYQ